jgi:hypothetical protein
MYQASIGETEDVRPLARAALALDAGLQSSGPQASEMGLFGSRSSPRSGTRETRSQRLHFVSRRSKPLDDSADVGLACGSPGAGLAGPPAHMIAFRASHASLSASRSLFSAALRIGCDWRKQRR